MFVDVEAFLFHAGTNPESVHFLDAEEEQEATCGGPEVDDKYSKALGSEESPAVTVESAIGCGEQSRHQCAENTANAMNRRSTHGIVDVKTVVDELYGIDKDNSTYQSDNNSTDG